MASPGRYRQGREAVTEPDPIEKRPSRAQRRWLRRGLAQPGGKLPLFDRSGQRVSDRLVQACIRHGWAEPWFDNPLKPDWLVCRLTASGRLAAEETEPPANAR